MSVNAGKTDSIETLTIALFSSSVPISHDSETT